MCKILSKNEREIIKNKNLKFLENTKDYSYNQLINSAEIGLSFDYTINKLLDIINNLLKSVQEGNFIKDESNKTKLCITLNSNDYADSLLTLKQIL